jgi:peptidyl-prolyl cis-trans isomerase D
MLQTIRDRPWIAYAILVPIIVAMAFFGIESYFATKVDTYAARIEGPKKFFFFGGQEVEITPRQFGERLDAERRAERERLGDAFDPVRFESLDRKRQVLDRLIDEELLGLIAQREGITVAEAQAAAELKSMPQFQTNGAYDETQYRLALAGANQSHAQFMAGVRANMARQALPDEIIETAIVGKGELETFLSLMQQTRDLQVVDLPVPTLPPGEPDAAALKKWYDDHAADYRAPEQVAIEYVEIDASTLPPPAAPDEKVLRERYAQQRARFVTDPQRSAAHILVAVPADADAAAEAAAQARAAEIATRARAAGADFAAIARETSDDLGSKASGGELGVVEAGMIDPAFEAALFAMTTPGQVSEPVRSASGWHVIQLRGITPGNEKPFEEVRAELEQEYLATENERIFADRAGRLLELIYRTPTALEPAAKELGLTLQRTPLFSRDRGEGIAALEVVRRAAFNDNQRLERQVSDTLEIGPGHVVAIHVIDHQPEAQQPYEQVAERVRADYDADRLSKASQAQAEALLARARKGETLDALATGLGRTVSPLPAVGRRSQMPPELVREAFALSAPTAEAPAFGIARIGPDRHVLFQVTAVTPGDLSMLDDETRATLMDQFARARGEVEFMAYLQSLRAGYEITVAEDRL